MAKQETGKQTPTLGERFFHALAENPQLLIENTGNMYSFDDENGSINDMAEKVRQGLTPVIIANHQGLSDAPALAVHVVQRLNSLLEGAEFDGFNVLASSSLKTGDQADGTGLIYDYLVPAFDKMGFYLVSVIRQKDRDVYGMHGSNDEAREVFFNSAKMNRGIIAFPEGTVKAGRRREDGKIHGLQQFEPNGWHQQFLRQYGSRVAVLPVGLHGGFRILDPDTFSIGDEVMEMMLGDTPVKEIASIKLGRVLTGRYADLSINSFLMQTVASLIPYEARGSWNAVFEYRPER